MSEAKGENDDAVRLRTTTSEAPVVMAEDYTMYPHMDGYRKSAHWRLADYGERGAFSEDECVELAKRFELPRMLIDELSILVGNSLDVGSHVNLVAVNRQKAIQRAERTLKKAVRHSRSRGSGKHIRDALVPLQSAFARDDDEAEILLSAQALARDDATKLDELLSAAELILASPGCAADMSPSDRRKISDMRREHVVRSCCYIWADADRKVTYSSREDPERVGLRHGELITFINVVVSLVTHPSIQLSGETLRADIDRFKKILADPDGILGKPEFGTD